MSIADAAPWVPQLLDRAQAKIGVAQPLRPYAVYDVIAVEHGVVQFAGYPNHWFYPHQFNLFSRRPEVSPDPLWPAPTAGVDPTGRSQHEPGAKADAGKPRPALVLGGFAHALQDVVEVGTFGAIKYIDNGWRDVPDGQRRYMDAALRHLLAALSGEPNDKESGLPHLSHAAWNLLAVQELWHVQSR